MRCAMQDPHCLRTCDVRPIKMEAICWRCWYERFGKRQAVREWKRKRWWRRLIP